MTSIQPTAKRTISALPQAKLAAAPALAAASPKSTLMQDGFTAAAPVAMLAAAPPKPKTSLQGACKNYSIAKRAVENGNATSQQIEYFNKCNVIINQVAAQKRVPLDKVTNDLSNFMRNNPLGVALQWLHDRIMGNK